MATDKTTTKVKKSSKKTDIKQDAQNVAKSTAELMDDLRSMSVAEINKALQEAKDDLKQAQKMLKANELPATHVVKQMRQKIARIHTVMSEQANNKEAK